MIYQDVPDFYKKTIDQEMLFTGPALLKKPKNIINNCNPYIISLNNDISNGYDNK